MRSECIQAVTEAAARAGRTVTSADLRGIEQRIKQAARDNARENPAAAQKMSPQEIVQAAADRVARDIAADRERAVANIARQVVAHDRNQRFVDQLVARGQRATDAIQRLLVGTLDNKSGTASLEQNREGVLRTYKARLEPIAKATQQYLGFWTNRAMVRDVLRELYGEDTGNAQAKSAAGIWRDQIAEPMRQHFNDLGGNIRKLRDWAVPQDHSQRKVAAAGLEQWIADVMPRLDRDAYRNADGTAMSDTEVQAMLGHVWQTIATDGAWNTTPAERGGSVKNRGDDRRVLHFADADAYLDYQAKYGERSVLETMNAHVDSMAKNIATLQTFGPNAEAGFKQLLDSAVNRDASANMPSGALSYARALAEKMFDVATGKTGAAANPNIAHRVQIARSFIAGVKLGGAALSAITDSSNIIATARAWNIPAISSWAKWESKAWASAEHRQFMRSQGVGVEAVAHAVSRYGEETFGHGIASNFANTIFRISGLNFIDNVRRTAAGAMLYSRIGDLLREHATLDDAHPADVARLVDGGVSEKTWSVWRAAELDGEYGITPDAIARIPDEAIAHLGNPQSLRRDAMQMLVGVTSRDIDTVVPMMTDKTRARMELRLPQRGTVMGELGRSILQFKSFPIAMIHNNWQRLIGMPTPGTKFLYAAEMLATSTVLGAISIQLKSFVAGNNPQDMVSPEFRAQFAARAFKQGGSTGLLGDILVDLATSPYKNKLSDQLGPIASTLGDLHDLARALLDKAKDPTAKSDAGGEFVRVLKGNTPGASLFYLKAAFDHLLFQRMQEYFSPGYNERMRQRTQKFYGSSQWWPASTANAVSSPQPPDLSTALGGRQ